MPPRRSKKVKAAIAEIDLEGEYMGVPRSDIPGVEATCLECGHTTESYGQEGPSIRRCLVLLREECPLGANNFYIAEV